MKGAHLKLCGIYLCKELQPDIFSVPEMATICKQVGFHRTPSAES